MQTAQAEIRIVGCPAENENVIIAAPGVEVSQYNKEFTTLTDQGRYLVTDRQLDQLREDHSVDTDF